MTCAAVKWGEYAFSTYWAWGCPPLRCTRRTPDPWTAAAAPWSCSAGNPSASHIRPAPWSSPRRTPPTGHAQKADRKEREWLNSKKHSKQNKNREIKSLQLPEYSQHWYLWVCVCLRGLFRCQAEAKRQRCSMFGLLQCARVKPRHPCFSHASPGTHTNTNTHTEYKCSRSYDLSRTPLFSSLIDHHYKAGFIRSRSTSDILPPGETLR